MAESRVTQALIEAGLSVNNNARVTQVATEIAESPTNFARVTQIALEVVLQAGTPPPTLTAACPVVTTGLVGQSYSQSIVVTGGAPPYTFAIVSGSLPPGLSLNTSTGLISGVFTVAGTFAYSVKVTDSLANIVTINCSFTVTTNSIINYPFPCP